MSYPQSPNPWLQLPAAAPYVLPQDHAQIEAFNQRYPDDEWRIRLNLPPVPFLGHPDAPIVLLNLNPGFDEADNERQNTPYYSEASRRCYAHEKTERPFFFFDEKIEGEPYGEGPGYRWWQKRVKGLKALDARFDDALLSRAFLCVEYFPYRSKAYRPLPRQQTLDSQQYGFELVRRAMERNALIIVMRRKRQWCEKVERLTDYPRLLTVTTFLNPVLHLFQEKEGQQMVVAELNKLLVR